VPTKVWTVGGKLEPNFLKPGANVNQIAQLGRGAEGAGGEIEGSLSATGVPIFGGSFRGLSASVNGLNIPVNGAAWLQRLRFSLQMQSLRDGAPFSFSACVGLSLAPRISDTIAITVPGLGAIPIVPAEKASIDGDFTVGWSSLSLNGANDLTISGKAEAKVWDQSVGTGTLSLYPGQGLFGGSLVLGVTDPSGGTLFTARGGGELWFDARRGTLGTVYLQGRGQLTVLGVGATGDLVITGPSPMVAGACMELFGYRLGLTYNYSTGQHSESQTCDLSAFRALKPSPPEPVKTAAANGASRSFKAAGNEGLLAVQVPALGASGGAPVATLTGPGVKLASNPTKAVKTARALAIANVAAHTVTFYVGRPRKGTYRLRAGAGSRLGTPRFAQPLPDPQVDGDLTPSACSPSLRWRATPVRGQSVRIIEQTAALAIRVLSESTGTNGTLAITPLPAAGRTTVSAQVLNGASVRATVPLGTYISGVRDRVPGPRIVKVTKGGKGRLKAAWTAVCGAERYAVSVGSGPPKVVGGRSLVLRSPRRNTTLTVTSLGSGNTPGGSTLVPLER